MGEESCVGWGRSLVSSFRVMMFCILGLFVVVVRVTVLSLL